MYTTLYIIIVESIPRFRDELGDLLPSTSVEHLLPKKDASEYRDNVAGNSKSIFVENEGNQAFG